MKFRSLKCLFLFLPFITFCGTEGQKSQDKETGKEKIVEFMELADGEFLGECQASINKPSFLRGVGLLDDNTDFFEKHFVKIDKNSNTMTLTSERFIDSSCTSARWSISNDYFIEEIKFPYFYNGEWTAYVKISPEKMDVFTFKDPELVSAMNQFEYCGWSDWELDRPTNSCRSYGLRYIGFLFGSNVFGSRSYSATLSVTSKTLVFSGLLNNEVYVLEREKP